jgi:hypothetical protein
MGWEVEGGGMTLLASDGITSSSAPLSPCCSGVPLDSSSAAADKDRDGLTLNRVKARDPLVGKEAKASLLVSSALKRLANRSFILRQILGNVVSVCDDCDLLPGVCRRSRGGG